MVLEKITEKIYKTSGNNEVKAQVTKAKKSKISSPGNIAKNMISGKMPKVKY